MQENLIDNRESLIQKAAYLRITTRSLASALQSGTFRSLFRGQGIEFSGVREYLRGDDVRAIDWNVTARNGKPFVKVFEEERELQIFLIVDRSLSMMSGSKGRTRLETATEIAALLTLSAEHNGNPVGAVLFGDDLEFAIEPKCGQNQTMLLLTRLDEPPKALSGGSVLANALAGAGKILHKRSLIFVISDFRVNDWETPFVYLANRHDVVAVRISDKMDVNLPEVGTVMFRDHEQGIKKLFPTNSKMFRSQWKEDGLMRAKRWKDTCIRRGGVPLSVSTADDTLQTLTSFFTQREM